MELTAREEGHRRQVEDLQTKMAVLQVPTEREGEGGRVVGEWWESGGRVVGEWWESGGRVGGEWGESGGKIGLMYCRE